MKVALDARWIFREISGIGEYTRELIRHLARLDTDSEYLLLFADAGLRERTVAETGVAEARNFRALLVPYGVFSPAGQFRLPRLLQQAQADLYHSPNYMIPFLAFPPRGRRTTRCITTIHDVIPLIFPNHAPRSRKARVFPLFKRLMREVGRRADVIITDSQASAGDIRRQLRIPDAAADKIRAIPCGVAARFVPPPQPKPRAPDNTRQLLYVGRADPYKNVDTLIRAFAETAPGLPFPTRLVIAGSPDPRYPEARRLAGELGLTDRVTWTGYLSDEELVRLYQDSDVLVHPSRYEGFGLQVLEAMACGLPVVSSNAASLPEVAGDAAILVSPDDRAGLGAGIARILTDPAQAATLVERGLQRAATFTWERTAHDTLAVYRGVMEADGERGSV